MVIARTRARTRRARWVLPLAVASLLATVSTPVQADDKKDGDMVSTITGQVRLPDGSEPGQVTLVAMWLVDPETHDPLGLEPVIETAADERSGVFEIGLAHVRDNGGGPVLDVLGDNVAVGLRLGVFIPGMSDLGEAVVFIDGMTEVRDGLTHVEVPVASSETDVVMQYAEQSAVALPCPDVENGCDRTWLDPFDPTGRYGWPDVEDTGGLLYGAQSTNSFSRQTGRGAFTAVNFNSIRRWDGQLLGRQGSVGIDHGLGHPSQNASYWPCKHPDSDPYQGACMNPGNKHSYTYAKNWYKDGTTNFRYGLFIGNSTSKATCAYPCRHYWGQRTQRIDVELYPKYDTGTQDVNFVRARFAQNWQSFTNHANGGTYGPAVGQVRLNKIGQAGIAHVYGYVTWNGLPVSEGEVSLRFWQRDTNHSSTGGQGLQSFAIPNTNGAGYYDAGAVYAGSFRIYVIDNMTGACRMIPARSLAAGNRQINFDVAKNDFGQGMIACS